MAERDIQADVMMAASKDGARLFRANAGMAWAGQIVSKSDEFITLRNPRPVHLLFEGFSDTFGWTATGQFMAIEVKKPGHRTRTDRLQAQQRFIAAVLAAGGRAGFAESVEQARAIWAP